MPNGISSMWRRSRTRTPLGLEPVSSPGAKALFSSRARSTFLPISPRANRKRTMGAAGGRASVIAFAVFVVVAIAGTAFAVGYVIGRMLL